MNPHRDDRDQPPDPFEFDPDEFERAFASEFGATASPQDLANEPTNDLGNEPTNELADESLEELNSGSLMCVVWTPIASGEALAGICALQKLEVDVIPSSQGALAAVEIPVTADIDFELLTHAVPVEVEKIAQALSSLVQAGVVLLSARLRQGEDGIAGDITAVAYENGERGEKVAPGLVLARADDSLLQLLTGTTTLPQIPNRIDVRTLSARKAAQYIRKGIRRTKK